MPPFAKGGIAIQISVEKRIALLVIPNCLSTSPDRLAISYQVYFLVLNFSRNIYCFLSLNEYNKH